MNRSNICSFLTLKTPSDDSICNITIDGVAVREIKRYPRDEAALFAISLGSVSLLRRWQVLWPLFFAAAILELRTMGNSITKGAADFDKTWTDESHSNRKKQSLHSNKLGLITCSRCEIADDVSCEMVRRNC